MLGLQVQDKDEEVGATDSIIGQGRYGLGQAHRVQEERKPTPELGLGKQQ